MKKYKMKYKYLETSLLSMLTQALNHSMGNGHLHPPDL